MSWSLVEKLILPLGTKLVGQNWLPDHGSLKVAIRAIDTGSEGKTNHLGFLRGYEHPPRTGAS